MNIKKVNEIPSGLRTKVYTQVWNIILRSHDFYDSKAFKDRLNNYESKTGARPIQQVIISSWEMVSIEIIPSILGQSYTNNKTKRIE